jgi:hypothetical protein
MRSRQSNWKGNFCFLYAKMFWMYNYSQALPPHTKDRMTQVRQLSPLLSRSGRNPLCFENSTGPAHEAVVVEFKKGQYHHRAVWPFGC